MNNNLNKLLFMPNKLTFEYVKNFINKEQKLISTNYINDKKIFAKNISNSYYKQLLFLKYKKCLGKKDIYKLIESSGFLKNLENI